MKEKAGHKKFQLKLPKKPWDRILIGVFFVIIILILSMAGYVLAYKSEFYPNTFISSVNVGGKTQADAEKLLTDSVDTIQDVSVTLDNKAPITITIKDLGVDFKVKETVNALYLADHTGGVFNQFKVLMQSLVDKHDHTLSVVIDKEKANAAIAASIPNLGIEPQDAKIVMGADNALSITPAVQGNGVTPDEIISELEKKLSMRSDAVVLTSHTTQPDIQEADLGATLESVKDMLKSAPITLKAGDKTTNVTQSTLFSWISYKRVQSSVKPEINRDSIKMFLTDFAKSINREAQNATLKAVDGAVQIDKPAVDGVALSIDPSVDMVIAQLDSAPAPLTISLTVITTKAKVSSENFANLGVKELIGRGETSFVGSPSNRIHNITTGTKFLNGALIAPGEEFSTVKTLGAVDGSTGYLPELVIKDNSTIPEYGGGLCQVSTTLFRSVLNAGLKVTERSNHSYRVSYYEPPIGLDASIYLPKPDFKFKNDTPAYIFVQGKVQGTKVSFELYGTKDGRNSTISDPIVTNITEPPAPLYVETDTLPKGTTKQIEKAHPGANAEVTYTVIRDGQEINRQVFKSRYKAWQARYLVGTKE